MVSFCFTWHRDYNYNTFIVPVKPIQPILYVIMYICFILIHKMFYCRIRLHSSFSYCGIRLPSSFCYCRIRLQYIDHFAIVLFIYIHNFVMLRNCILVNAILLLFHIRTSIIIYCIFGKQKKTFIPLLYISIHVLYLITIVHRPFTC